MGNKAKGKIGELKVMTELLSQGFSVYQDCVDEEGIDLLVLSKESDEKISKVQVKYASESFWEGDFLGRYFFGITKSTFNPKKDKYFIFVIESGGEKLDVFQTEFPMNSGLADIRLTPLFIIPSLIVEKVLSSSPGDKKGQYKVNILLNENEVQLQGKGVKVSIKKYYRNFEILR